MTGNEPRPLPIRLRPRTAETTASYIRRLARANHLRPSVLDRYLRNGQPGGAIRFDWLAALADRHPSDLAKALAEQRSNHLPATRRRTGPPSRSVNGKPAPPCSPPFATTPPTTRHCRHASWPNDTAFTAEQSKPPSPRQHHHPASRRPSADHASISTKPSLRRCSPHRARRSVASPSKKSTITSPRFSAWTSPTQRSAVISAAHERARPEHLMLAEPARRWTTSSPTPAGQARTTSSRPAPRSSRRVRTRACNRSSS